MTAQSAEPFVFSFGCLLYLDALAQQSLLGLAAIENERCGQPAQR
jgi:hypothetical protein